MRKELFQDNIRIQEKSYSLVSEIEYEPMK